MKRQQKWTKTHNKSLNQLDGYRKNWLGLIWKMSDYLNETKTLVSIYPDKHYTIMDDMFYPYHVEVIGTKVTKILI